MLALDRDGTMSLVRSGRRKTDRVRAGLGAPVVARAPCAVHDLGDGVALGPRDGRPHEQDRAQVTGPDADRAGSENGRGQSAGGGAHRTADVTAAGRDREYCTES